MVDAEKVRVDRIESERLVLRPLARGDCTPVYAGWLADPEISRFLETRHSGQSIEDIAAFVEGVNAHPSTYLFGIFLKGEDRHIGNIKVGPVGTHHPLADVSLLIGARDCWGKGYATEAIRTVSRFAFERLGVRKLSASMYAPNQGSTSAFLKCGYRQEGLRHAHYLLDGEMCDLVELGLRREDLFDEAALATPALRLRLAREDDSARLLAWRNDPLTRQNSKSDAEVSQEEHDRWFGEQLRSADVRFLIGECGEPIGTVRFNRSGPGYVVSITVAPEARGRKLGLPLLSLACAGMKWHPLIAEIKDVNEPSIRLFAACGFRRTGDGAAEGLGVYERPPGDDSPRG